MKKNFFVVFFWGIFLCFYEKIHSYVVDRFDCVSGHFWHRDYFSILNSLSFSLSFAFSPRALISLTMMCSLALALIILWIYIFFFHCVLLSHTHLLMCKSVSTKKMSKEKKIIKWRNKKISKLLFFNAHICDNKKKYAKKNIYYSLQLFH